MKAKRKIIEVYKVPVVIPRPGYAKRKPKHWGECDYCRKQIVYGEPCDDLMPCINVRSRWTPRKKSKGARK